MPYRVSVTSPLAPAHRPPTGLVVASWFLAFVPLLCLGMLTAPLFAVAAARARSLWLTASAVGYTATTVVMFVTAGSSDPLADTAFTVTTMVNMFGGTVHALLVRGRVVRGRPPHPGVHPGVAHAPAGPYAAPAGTYPPPPFPTPPGPPPPGAPSLVADPVVRAALARRERRQQARRIVTDDPQLASELRIGRPDLPREFDDGGLVDVNNVPTDALTSLPGISPELAGQIARAAAAADLTSAEDLVVYADLPPGLAESLREYVIFRPRWADPPLTGPAAP